MSEQVSPEQIMQVGLGFWPSKVLLSAVEMELFTDLAKGPQSLETLQQSKALHPRGARDFLDTLVALGFLQRNDGRYANTPSTDAFLDKNKPAYLGGILEMANARLFGFWNHLTEALRTGLPQNEARTCGQAFFEALYSDPARLKNFLEAMTGLSHPANMTIAKQFPWAQYKTFADAGAAQGDLAVQIALANPHLSGIGFDLPMVEPIFAEYVQKNDVAHRVRFQAGSFLERPLPKADVILMGHILHDWGLDDKKMLIAKAYAALPEGGALIVYEGLIDDDRSQNAFGLMMSLNMLIETPAGFDYSGADCQRWMKEAGFRETRVEHLVGPDAMVVGIK